jgi:hypothetical protein
VTCPEDCHCDDPEHPGEDCPVGVPADEPWDDDVQYFNQRWTSTLGVRRPGRWDNVTAWAEEVVT